VSTELVLTDITVESCFEKADEFIPERWYSKPEMVRDKRAFAPFSQGK
jgi:cytochrome P450